MKLKTGFENHPARIEMMPLMDVIFLLLVFFLYAMVTMSVHHGIGVTLPQAISESIVGHHAQIVLTEEGGTYLEGEAVSEQSLVPRVVNECMGMPILISADERVPIGRGLALLAELREAGISEVAFRTVAPVERKKDVGR